MRRAAIVSALALAATLGCRGSTEIPEAGAILLRAHLAPGAPMPDELRLFVYDDTGILWQNVRTPSEGPLVAESATLLGTIVLKPGTTVGDLRIDVHGLADGSLVDEATLVIPPDERGQGTFDLTLSGALPSDTDGDGVPDPVDDCPTIPDPAQTGCRADGGSADAAPARIDAGPDAPARAGAGGGVGGAGGSTGGAAGRTGQAGAGGAAGQSGTGGSTGGAAGRTGQAGAGGAAGQSGTGGSTGGAAGRTGQAGAAGRAGASGSTGGAAGHAVGGGGSGGTGKLPQGAACSDARSCATGFCKDGACCDTGCTDACNSCATGTCTEVTNASDDPECPEPLFACNKKGQCIISLSLSSD
jgi:hypothetical protein